MFTSSLISIQLNKLQIYIIVKSIVAYVLKCKSVLDKIVNRLQAKGFDNTSYNDKM